MRRLVLFAFLVGCGDDAIDFGDYTDELLEARCSYFVRCGLFVDQAACRAYAARTAVANPNDQAVIDAGKVNYDGEAAARCADAIKSASCDTTSKSSRELDPSCDEIFSGNSAAGASCIYDAECESLSCVVSTCTMACCPGICAPVQAPAPLGASCAMNECEVGLYCGSDNVCHALVPAGAACDAPDACDYGLGCVGNSTTADTCKVLPKLGEPCPDSVCAELGAVCNGSTCREAGLPGDPCASSFDCSFYYTCDATNHCATHPTLGMPCTFTCSDASYCNMTTRICEAQQPNGSMCLRNDECASHFCNRIGTPNGICGDIPLCF